MMDKLIDKKEMNGDIRTGLLEKIADLHGTPQGAYNIRENGEAAARANTDEITIETKEDKPGINIIVKSGKTKVYTFRSSSQKPALPKWSTTIS